jgi:hypothetical protein
MKSIFNKTDNQELIDRINKLSPSSKAQWGKMNVSQMLAHCQHPLRVAYGEMKLKRGLMSFLFGKMVKNKLVKDEKPFDKGNPTAPEFLVPGQFDFETEKQKLVAIIKRFGEQGPSKLSKDPHPFFGKMTEKEWDVLSWKHMDHHLRQFGA